MTGIQSEHSWNGDRTFRHQCHGILLGDQPIHKKGCSISEGTSLYQSFLFSCDRGKFLSGESSHFHRKDRAFRWNCCAIEDEYKMELEPNQCVWSPWANSYGSPVQFFCPKDQVLAGIKREWSPQFRGDRIYSYLCCSLKSRVD